jgi:hypothetical protein
MDRAGVRACMHAHACACVTTSVVLFDGERVCASAEFDLPTPPTTLHIYCQRCGGDVAGHDVGARHDLLWVRAREAAAGKGVWRPERVGRVGRWLMSGDVRGSDPFFCLWI